MQKQLELAVLGQAEAGIGNLNGRDKQRLAWREAASLTPRGVHSNYRFWGDDITPVVTHGKGCRIWDVDGNQYIDYRNGFGAVFLGHGDEALCDAVNDAMRQGTTFTLSTPRETRAARLFLKLCPNMEQVRFCNSGTEATMHALRVARAATGREKVIKFEGNFHGVHDALLWSTAGGTLEQMGPADAPVPQAMSRGIPEANRSLVITLPIQNESLLEETLRAQGHQIAALIAEPVLGNAAGLTPAPEWFGTIRRLCDQYGIVFILDEVKTGFRLAPGGAQEVYGIRPDLATYAKALGNGFAVAAFGGRRTLMELIGPGSVTHGGTFAGNTVAMAAVEHVLTRLEDGAICRQVGEKGLQLQQGISALLSQAGIPHQLCGPPQLWGLVISEQPPKDFRDVLQSDRELYTRLMLKIMDFGAFPEPDVREPWFMSAAHSADDIALTLEAVHRALKTL